MEHRSGAVIDIFSTVTDNGGHRDGVDPKPKKKRSPMHILRVANYMLSLKSEKSKTANTDTVSKWKKLLSSMRPLHINSNQSAQRSTGDRVTMAPLTSKEVVEQSKVYAPSAASEEVEQFELFTPPWSPAPKSTGSSSGQTSQYASAQNLRELDDQSDEDDEDSYYDDKFGDEKIDMKAEEFIAKFYGQVKLQHKS
ncbi:PREDICTED: uncharacterized protein LOC105138434 [Populus euphratica]|uniref:Uncharacterized protein LOC105138434 n=1 Tax=Populus euphratica TaxID=75702 RepID=A0AAJ6Y524_POPEU|nr:PREDICTED: uncharacterized protein LOC105138434 [Populus euphratica]